jgi:regulator of telomere elongation helicase 1
MISVCPFYLANNILPQAEIVFLPYNYLLDHHTRLAQRISLKNAIVILDEGHNVESTCCESTSFDITVKDLEEMVNEIQLLIQHFHVEDQSTTESFRKEQFIQFLACIELLYHKIKQMELSKEKVLVKPGEFMYELMESVGIYGDRIEELAEMLEVGIPILTKSNFFRLICSTKIKVTFQAC